MFTDVEVAALIANSSNTFPDLAQFFGSFLKVCLPLAAITVISLVLLKLARYIGGGFLNRF